MIQIFPEPPQLDDDIPFLLLPTPAPPPTTLILEDGIVVKLTVVGEPLKP